MRAPVFPGLGEQLKRARQHRQMTQPALAARVGRDRARISELERDLANNRLGRDRLTLLAEICDALDLVPVLVPRDRAAAVRAEVDGAGPGPAGRSVPRTTFEEVFVDLSEDGAEGRA